MCNCGRGQIVCQGVCGLCRIDEEKDYCAKMGLAPRARAVGIVCGVKKHNLVARAVVWGGTPTLRWVPVCQTSSRAYGYKMQEGTEVTCLRCKR